MRQDLQKQDLPEALHFEVVPSGLQLQGTHLPRVLYPRFSYFSAWVDIVNAGLGVPVSLGTASLKIPART